MSITIRKLGVLAVMAALLVVLAALRPTAQTPVAQADLGSPGGIAALPSAAPALPGIANQGAPAIIGTGQAAIVAVFCAPPPAAGTLPFAAGPCSEVQESGPMVDGFGWVSLKLTQVWPPGGSVPMAVFAATGSDTMVVTDNSGGDQDIAPGVIAVEVDAAAATQGGTQGVNEIVKVTVTDETGDVRSVSIVVVDTILAWGPTGAISTASQEQPTFVSYHCPALGRTTGLSGVSATFAEGALALNGGNGSQGLDDMYDAYYAFTGAAFGWGTNTLVGDADFSDVWCGGNSGSMFDDFVDFSTDKGIFSVDPGAVALQNNAVSLGMTIGYFYPPSLDFDCGEGKNIDTFDIDALTVYGGFLNGWPPGGNFEGGCDVDGWANGVVTTQLLGMGEVGVATITAQQGGGVSPVRTINVTFEGEAAMSLFITAPASIGLTGDAFTVALVDQDGRPIADETVQCTVDPAAGALTLLNQTGTTGAIGSGSDGKVTFTLIPTGAAVLAGDKLTITCVLDSDRSVKTSKDVSLSSTPNLETKDLVEGCNPFAATWPDGTKIDAVAGAVTPADALGAIWKFAPATKSWLGFSPTAPADVNNLPSVDRLDAIFICVSAAAKVSRPVI